MGLRWEWEFPGNGTQAKDGNGNDPYSHGNQFLFTQTPSVSFSIA